MNPRLKELFSNTVIFTIANFSSKILVFLMVPLYTAVLSTEEYGISDMVNTTTGLLMPILSLSISSAVLRFCFIKDYSSNEVYTIGHNIIIKGTIVAVVVTGILFFLRLLPQLDWYIWFVPPLFFLQLYSGFLSNFSRGIGEVKLSAISGVANTFTTVLFNLLFLLVFKWGITGYMLSFLIGSFVSVCVMLIKLTGFRRILHTTNKGLQVHMIKFSAPLIPNDLSWWALDSFNRFFILSTLSVSAVGIYSASSKIPSILTAICGIFSQAWMLSALNGYGTEENRSFIKAIHAKMFCLLTVITGAMILFTKPIASLLLSGDFSTSWNIIPFLLIAVFMGAMVGFYGSIYSAERKNTMQFVSTMGGAILSVIIMLLFLKRYGIMIAAISNMVGYILIWVVRKEGIKRFIDIGMSTLLCVVQLFLLIIEALLVSFSLWTPSAVLFSIIILINLKELKASMTFFKGLMVKH